MRSVRAAAAAAYKMDYLYFVTIRKRCRAPFCLSDYLAVDLYGEPRGFEAEALDQVFDK